VLEAITPPHRTGGHTRTLERNRSGSWRTKPKAQTTDIETGGPTLKPVAVESTTISTVTYDSDREILEVEFRDRSVYQYLGVQRGTWRLHDRRVERELLQPQHPWPVRLRSALKKLMSARLLILALMGGPPCAREGSRENFSRFATMRLLAHVTWRTATCSSTAYCFPPPAVSARQAATRDRDRAVKADRRCLPRSRREAACTMPAM